METRPPSTDQSSSKTFFADYYNMMLSVIHGLVLGGAVAGLVTEVVSIENSTAIDNGWNLPRWAISSLFALTTAWKYLVKSYFATWKLDLLDMAIPSLLGVVLSASFLVVREPLGWVGMIAIAFAFGASAGIYALRKIYSAKDTASLDERTVNALKSYKKNLWINVVGGIVVVALVAVFYLVGTETFAARGAAFLLLAFALLQLHGDHSLQKTMKSLSEV